MKNLVKFLIAALASMSLTSVASAGTFSPIGPTTLSGSIVARKLLTLGCDLTATITSNGTITSNPGTTGTFATALAIDPGDSNCARWTSSNFNWPITSVDADTIRFHDVDVVVMGIGNCSGTVDADLNSTTGMITFSAANLFSMSSGGSCSLAGSVPTSPAASYTYP